MKAPQIEDRHQALLRQLCDQTLAGGSCTVWIFGSRARGTAGVGADVDLAVESPVPIDGAVRTLRERLEESTLPYFADVVDLQTAAPELRRQVKSERVLLWRG